MAIVLQARKKKNNHVYCNVSSNILQLYFLHDWTIVKKTPLIDILRMIHTDLNTATTHRVTSVIIGACNIDKDTFGEQGFEQ